MNYNEVLVFGCSNFFSRLCFDHKSCFKKNEKSPTRIFFHRMCDLNYLFDNLTSLSTAFLLMQHAIQPRARSKAFSSMILFLRITNSKLRTVYNISNVVQLFKQKFSPSCVYSIFYPHVLAFVKELYLL